MYRVFALTIVSCCFGSLCAFGDTSLTAGTVTGAPGDEVEVEVLLDGSDIECQGISLGLSHDDELLTLEDISQGDALLDLNGGAGPSYWFVNVEPFGGPGGFSAFVADDLAVPGIDTLESEDDLQVFVFEYTISEDAEGGDSSDIEFTEELAASETAPTVAIVVADSGANVELTLADGEVSVASGVVSIVSVPSGGFLRGDVDGDGELTPILDALYLLEYGFQNGEEPSCMDAADVDDDGVVFPILDTIDLLEWGFKDGDAPPSPGVETCGDDPTDDEISCESPPDC